MYDEVIHLKKRGGSGIQTITAGYNISITGIDPLNPTINADLVWGEIVGDINDQTDLIELINSAGSNTSQYDYYDDDMNGYIIRLPFIPVSIGTIIVAGLPQREGKNRDYIIQGSKIVFNYQLENDDVYIPFTYLPI